MAMFHFVWSRRCTDLVHLSVVETAFLVGLSVDVRVLPKILSPDDPSHPNEKIVGNPLRK